MPVEIETVEMSDGSVAPVTRPKFDAVSSLLKKLPSRGIGLIWGVASQEEINHYAYSLGVNQHLTGIMNGKYFNIRQESARLSYQYARNRYKVESFLWRSIPSSISLKVSEETTLEFIDIFDFAASATWQQLVQYMKPRYAATRRVRDGIDSDIHDYLLPFRKFTMQGDVVIRWPAANATYENLIQLWAFYHSSSNTRLVILTDTKPRWSSSHSIIDSMERGYITVSDLIESSVVHFHRSHQSVQEAFGLWQRGANREVNALIKRGFITEMHADSFLRAYAPLVTEDDIPNLGIIVPSQQPAPLRFRASGNFIDIIDEKEFKPGEARIVGSAVACISALQDLESYTGFHNAIPTFSSKSARIRSLLQLLAAGDYDDNAVVQLGVEVELLEQRIANSSEMISDMALAESASLFPMLQGLLHQFAIWSRYKSKMSEGSTSQEASQSAVDVLSTASAEGKILTPRAQGRVEDYVSGVAGPDVDEGETGAVLVVENMAAQAASAIAQESHERGEPVSPSLAESIAKSDNNGAAKWMIENAEDLNAFAVSGKVSWLKTFLGALGRKS